MGYWTCTICDIRMEMQSREPHLAGSRHRAAANGHLESIPLGTAAQENSTRWTCLICNIEMQIQNRDSHLAGRRHADTEDLLQAQEASIRWTCSICDIEMPIGNRDSHLAGRRHADAESESISQAAMSQEISLRWTCFICEIEMPIGNRDSHLAGKRHAAAVSPPMVTTASSSSTKAALPPSTAAGGSTRYTAFKTSDSILFSGWQCTICSCNVPLSVMQSHLRSLDHIQKVLEMLKITCTAMPQPEIQGSGKSSENLDYQGLVEGTKSLVSYLTTQTSHKYVPTQSAPTSTHHKSATKSSTNSASHPSSSQPPPTGPLDQFFLSFPAYPYDPTIPPASSFRSFQAGLSRWDDFNESVCSTWDDYKKDVWERYQAALTAEFNLWFGTEDELESWYALCRAIGIQPLPATRKKCREAVRNRHVNIVDLIQWAREREVGQVRIFRTVRELSEYSYAENKIYRREQLGQGAVLRHLLRHLGMSLDE